MLHYLFHDVLDSVHFVNFMLGAMVGTGMTLMVESFLLMRDRERERS